MTAQNDRGQMSASAAVTLVVGLMIFGVLAAVMLPVAINEIEGDTTTTLTQDEDTTYEVNSRLNSNVTGTTIATTDTATIELNDTRTSGTTSKTVDNQTTADYDMEGGTVTVGLENVDDSTSPNQATVNYTYTNDYAYGDGASSLWGILGLAIVLAAVLFIFGTAFKFTNRL